MKTEQEIKEKINIYKKMRDKAFIFTSEFSLASGAIAALEWVLQSERRCDGSAECEKSISFSRM